MILNNLVTVTCFLSFVFITCPFVICYLFFVIFQFSFMIKQRFIYLIKIDVYYSIRIYKINFPILTYYMVFLIFEWENNAYCGVLLTGLFVKFRSTTVS